MAWVGPGDGTWLEERARLTCRGAGTTRTVDSVMTLTAADRRVGFNDDKEGLFGLRVARQLEQPSKTAEVFTDASGKATAVPLLDNTGVPGSDTTSEGGQGDEGWSTA